MDEQKCLVCKEAFRTFPSWAKRGRRFCSRECSMAYKKANPKRHTATCATCGKVFLRRNPGYKFCSMACFGRPRRKWGFEYARLYVVNGYERLQWRDEKTGEKIRLDTHRLVYEQRHGELAPSLDVHHIDGNKSNNDIANLQALTRSEHMKEHHRMRAEQGPRLKRQRDKER